MNYQPATIATAPDKRVVGKIIVGGERRLYVSNEQTKRIGNLFMAGDGSGTYSADPVWGVSDLSANPADLQVVSIDGFKSPAAAVLTLSGTGDDSNPLLGTATFAPPTWSRLQTFDFEKGTAFDITPSTAGRKFKVIAAATVAMSNALKGANFRIMALPTAASWVEVDKIEGVGVNHGNRPGVSIPEGLDATDEITVGRSGEQSLSINGFNRSLADGLERYAGQFCSVRVDIVAERKILKERQVYGNCILEVNPSFGGGSDLSTQAAEGRYEDYLGFFAP